MEGWFIVRGVIRGGIVRLWGIEVGWVCFLMCSGVKAGGLGS